MKALILGFLIGLSASTKPQVAINNTGALPNASAMLDINSTNRGLLAPRMTQAQRDAIASPATGLLIYQADNVSGYYYNAGTPSVKQWMLMGQNLSYWGTNGNHIYKLNPANVGIGTLNPEAYLEISGSATPQLIIKGVEGGFRPGIQFKNNYIHYISGDDLSDEWFGFYSKFSSQRSYGARLNIYGPALNSWDTYLGLRHDGGKAVIETDAGHLILKQGPNANFGVGTDVPQRFFTLYATPNRASEIQFVNNTTEIDPDDGATIGVLPVTPHAYFWNYENADMFLGTNNTRFITIKADGKMGLGISSPSAALHIYANSSATVPGLLLTESEADDARLMFKSTAQSSKNWMVSAGLNSIDPLSRWQLIFNNGINTPVSLFTVTGDGEIQTSRTGTANMIPIAYGTINTDGTKLMGTSNFTSLFNTDHGFCYEITITGENYSLSTHLAIVTPVTFSSSLTTDAYGGKLRVYFEDNAANSRIKGTFSFVVYKL